MSEEKAITLVWFRNDLRTVDHKGLRKAIESGYKVIAYYTFNPRHFQTLTWGFKKTDRFRGQFLIESVRALKTSLEALNISLIIDSKPPEEGLPKWIKKFHVQQIYLQHEWTEEEKKEEEALAKQISPSIGWNRHYEQFLFHPSDLPFSASQIPEVFGSFRKRCEKEIEVRTLSPSLSPMDPSNLIEKAYELPNLTDLGLKSIAQDKRTAFPFSGGTSAGTERLEHYFWKSKKLSYYKNTRNGLVGTDYSSKFSSWLANGSLSPKMIYWEIKRYEKEIRKNQSTYWLIFELIWRDYFKYISLKHGNKVFKTGGILERDYNWKTDQRLFNEWAEGRTSEPFVNANMIELKQTGWMSNRGRQNVASFFAKDMKMDWRIGAAYFESLLLDYDVHSNYGNWMYVSGVGNDPRDRKFDVQWQAERYDAQGKFQKHWLQKTLF
jgi:deoxyribodipyrimidine photo-lyase